MNSASPPAPAPVPAPAPASAPWAEPVAVSNLPTPGALAAVLRVTIARQLRGKRIWVFLLLFAAPVALALLARRHDPDFEPAEAARILIYGLIPQAILPLSALLFASSLVQDDVEEQTLTYLLTRPIPRWAIYVVKVVGAVLVTSVLAAVFSAGAIAAIRWGPPEYDADALLTEAGGVAVLWTLAVFAYIAIFGFLGLLTRRVLVIGVGYILVFEGIASNIPFLVRNGTILFHLRNLAVRMLGIGEADWSIDPALAPSATTSAAVLLGAAALFLVLGAWIFRVREFRVKTPEGS